MSFFWFLVLQWCYSDVSNVIKSNNFFYNGTLLIHSQSFDEQFMIYSTFCVHRGGNIIDSHRNIGLIRLIMFFILK